MSRGDTIAAVATAPGRGGVAVVRVSGPEAFQVAERLTGRAPKPRRVSLESIRASTSALIDIALVLAFKGPHSYTGEDVVEFQCHGGSVVPRRVLGACLASGARLARRGEFTERAFLNGRLTYEEAESVLDLVDAKTDRAADAALAGLSGSRRRELRALYAALVELSSTAEHALDVSEEELPDGFAADLESSAASLAARLGDAIRRAREGKILREGALVVIAGPPNAGKSSLLNALLGEDRAIVSATPGTTRDSIEEWLDVEGWPVRLVDTAGLPDTADAVEGEGVARARDLMEKADIIVHLSPADAPHSSPAASRPSLLARTIEVVSKCDLLPHHAPSTSAAGAQAPSTHAALPRESTLFVSAKTGEGLSELRDAVAAALARKAEDSCEDFSGYDRDVAAVAEALSFLQPPGKPREGLSGDLVLLANRVRAAAERLGAALGATYSSDLLDALFSRFCVGK